MLDLVIHVEYKAMYWRAEYKNGVTEERLVVAKASGRILDIVLVLEGEEAAKAMELVRRHGMPIDGGYSVDGCARITTVDYLIGEGVLTMIKRIAGE